MSILQRALLWFLKPSVQKNARKNLPELDGTFEHEGLTKPVKVYRDKWGIPHIYADNLKDLAFAQGYVHAQDRLWQMDMTRRAARGQISEIIGKPGLDTDRVTRTLGFDRLAQADLPDVPTDLRNDIESYCNGINTYIDKLGNNLAPEYKLLKFKPRKWDVIDVLATGRMLAWQMSFAWFGEVVRARIIDKVGMEHAKDLEIHYPDENPSGLEKTGEVNIVLDDGMLKAMNGPFLKPIKGSNGWAVAGSKTRSGSPLLCNDPHLPLTQPGLWYENHLCCDEVEVTGVSMPGLPMVLIGHNRNIAWGMTLAFTDIQDTYIEQFTDNTMQKYRFKDTELDSEIITEVIKIKGEKDHTERVVITQHGPVLSDVIGYDNAKLTLHSKALGKSAMIQGWYELNKAKDWKEFIHALKHIGAPALNVPYADTDGNIGYWVTGKVPIRKGFDGSLPAEGWTGEMEWEGEVPFEEMPHTYNPEKGYVVTCNHKIIPDDYPHFLGNIWMNGYRANRLEELFGKKEKFAIDDMKRMQLDVQCIPALQFIEEYRGLRLDDLNLDLMKQQLISWDGQLTTETVAGCIYQVTRHFMSEVLFEEKLGLELVLQTKGKGFNDSLIPQHEFYGYDTITLLRLLKDPENWWIKEAGGREKVMEESLKRAYQYLSEKLGEDMDRWHWGRVHHVTMHHPIGAKKPLDKLFNQGPYPIPGDTDTLLQTANMANHPLGDHIVAPSYRQIIDMGNLSNSVSVMPAGQSGNMMSPHYADQMQMWLDGKYHPMLWMRAEVEANKVHLMELIPKVSETPDLTIN